MIIKAIDFGDTNAAPPTEHRRMADLPDRVVEGDPQQRSSTFFVNETGDLQAGTWTSTPGKWHAFTDKDEFCYLTAGRVRLIAADGSAQVFQAGEAFLIPNGFTGFWEVLETATKHFVIRTYATE